MKSKKAGKAVKKKAVRAAVRKNASDSNRFKKKGVVKKTVKAGLGVSLPEDKYRDFFDQASDSIFIIDPNTGSFLDLNQSAARKLGYTKKELLKLKLFDINLPESKSEIKSRIKKQKAGKVVTFESCHRKKDGTTIPVEISSKIIKYGKKRAWQAIVRNITLRKQVERELKESEDRFKRLSEAAFEGILIAEKGKFIDFNHAFIDMFGYSRSELAGMNASDLAAPESRDTIIRNIASGYEKPYEAFGLRKDGSTFPVILYGKKAKYHGRDVRVTAIRDITERKKHEDRLIESEEKIRSITNALGEGVIVVDTDLKITFVNPTAGRLVGWKPEELVGKNAHHKFHYLKEDKTPYPYEECVALITVRKGNDFFNVEDAFVNKSGEIFPIELTTTSLRENGNIVGGVMVFRDITERRRAEEKLKLDAMVFKNTIEGIMITDADGVIQSVNAAFKTITGYRAEEAIGKTPRILKSSRHDKEFYKDMWETLKDICEWKGVVWNKRKNGDIYPQEMSINTIKNRRGEITHYTSIFSDITERKKAEDALLLLSSSDSLTGLANRRKFDELLYKEWSRAMRVKEPFSVVMIDIDYFKLYNDEYGHQAGDRCIQAVAGVFKDIVHRPGDIVARYGGEEFTVVLPVTEEENAVAIAESMRKGVEALKIRHKKSKSSKYVTISAGVATALPKKKLSSTDLIEQADKALYKAKRGGRNRVVQT